MKKILIVLICFSAVFSVAMFSSGCSLITPAAPTPVASPTPTSTSDITKDIIAGVLTNLNIVGSTSASYQVGVYSALGVTVTTAAVTVTGPNGIKTLVFNGTSGYYEYSSVYPADFQYGHKYTISVTDGAKTYAQDIAAPSDVTIPSDGSTLSWINASPGTAVNMIIVTTSAPVVLTYGPGISSPYNLVAAGAYVAGSGVYNVSAVITTTQIPAFGGSNPLSNVSVADTKTVFVIRP